MTQREHDEDDGARVHEIKFDEYGIMDDGVDESTHDQLAKLKSATGSNYTNYTILPLDSLKTSPSPNEHFCPSCSLI